MFGERLKSLRKDLGLSQSELGKVLDLSCTAISQYESETRFPDCETLIKISEYFGISLDYLFGQIDIKNPPLKEGRMVIDCAGFTNEQMKTIRFLIRSFQGINKNSAEVTDKKQLHAAGIAHEYADQSKWPLEEKSAWKNAVIEKYKKN